ncbi:MAG: TIM barrel protein [Bryobacteraceae bacterium]|nr:TIM barrel protein [Bryobacteraceae bacterium]
MLRRTALTLPLALAAAKRALRLSVRVEALFPGQTLTAQMERVAEAGYDAFEFGDWRAADAKAINARKRRLRLECACLVGNRSVNPVGMGLCDPAERAGFLAEIRASTQAAVEFETKQIVVLTGFKAPHLSRNQQRASIVEGLKRACDVVSPAGVTIILEPINTLAKVEPLNPKGNNHADYFLDHVPEALDLLRQVNHPHAKLLYDLYHAQIMNGNLIETIRGNIAQIAHVHVGDVPGRHEPGTGEIDHRNVFRALRDAGFGGYVAMEYVPQGDAMATLRAVRKLVEGL